MLAWCSIVGDENLVARPDVLAAVALRDEVHGLGRAAQENDLLLVGRADEVAHLFARALEGPRGPLGQLVGGAMNVRIVAAVEDGSRVDDALRLLRGRGVVEPDERLAVHLLVQRREILPDRVDIKAGKARAEAGQ